MMPPGPLHGGPRILHITMSRSAIDLFGARASGAEYEWNTQSASPWGPHRRDFTIPRQTEGSFWTVRKRIGSHTHLRADEHCLC